MADAFRAEVLACALPCWRAMAGVQDVQIAFEDARDDGAPPMPLILAISYPDAATMQAALRSSANHDAKAAMEDIIARMFQGRPHRHVTTMAAHGR